MQSATDLTARADDLRACFKRLEGIRGTGYHDEDRDLTQQHLGPHARKVAPQANGLSRCSEQPVAFTDFEEEQVFFAGEDADKVMALLTEFHAKYKSMDMTNAPGTIRKLILKIIPKLKVNDGLLMIWLCDWNDVLWLLENSKVGILGRAFVEDDSPMPDAACP